MEVTRPTSGVYKRLDGLWGWRIVDPNGETVASDAGQGYVDKDFAEHMFSRFRYLPPAPTEPQPTSRDCGLREFR